MKQAKIKINGENGVRATLALDILINEQEDLISDLGLKVWVYKCLTRGKPL